MILQKIYNRIIKLRLEPIRVFCFHHVCEQYDEKSMYLSDWMSINDFKKHIYSLRDKGYQFISLTEAYNHLKNDFFRKKKYAVITFDDGYMSLLEIIPWLISENISFTLFINGKYLDGTSFREKKDEGYLDYNTLFNLNNSLVEIGNHGWEHVPASNLSNSELINSVYKNVSILSSHPRYIPYWAYTYGNHNEKTDAFLKENKLNIVLMDGQKNYNDQKYIHRELI